MSANIYSNIAITLLTCLFLKVFFSKRVRDSSTWQATVTPLASIIGSGFLVSAPLLIITTGKYAPLVMLMIVIIAYQLGGVLRFNIKHVEPALLANENPSINRLESISRTVLGFAYIISVVFYLKLLSAFLLRSVSLGSDLNENILTTGIIFFIFLVSMFKGPKELEHLEEYAVNTKLSIIISTVIGHVFLNVYHYYQGTWFLSKHSHFTTYESFTKILGMLIIIQGFETSRYLGEMYSSSTRTETMKYAQIISGIIYVSFLASSLVLFNNIHQISETVVMTLCRMVAPILPFLLLIAAVTSQFSAAVADTFGSSGILVESFKGKITLRKGTLITCALGILCTWFVNIYEVITLASKAFALYYGCQCLLSLMLNKHSGKFRVVTFGRALILLVLMAMVIVFGETVE